jgi:hypothetical protein
MSENRSREIDGFVVDILPHLLKTKSEHLVYWKTDTHWTYQGAYDAYEVICLALNTSPRVGLKNRASSMAEIALDLGAKLTPPITEKCHFHHVLMNSKLTYKNEIVRFLDLLDPRFGGEMHVGASVRFENTSPNRDRRKILLFGDSFSEYRPHMFSGLLAETFETVQFVWSAEIDYGLVERCRPDIVVTEMTERFIGRVPRDDLDLSRLAYQRIAEFLNASCRAGEGVEMRWTYI